MRWREIAAHVWVHPPSHRTTFRIAEGGRKKITSIVLVLRHQSAPCGGGQTVL
jgi:hypothetical protein